MSTKADPSWEAATLGRQFLNARSTLLARYDAALAHAPGQPSTHDGNVGGAAVRDWLATFLPKRFGVTAGCIRKQEFEDAYVTSQFDVIIYDQLETPVLWVESSSDEPEEGPSLIIPAENVRVIIEVKSAFDEHSVTEALGKLSQLAPLMDGADDPGARCPRYLAMSTVLVTLFVELRAADKNDIRPVTSLRGATFERPFYGAVILRGEGLEDRTGRVTQTTGNESTPAHWQEDGLLGWFGLSETTPFHDRHLGAWLHWTAHNFSDFAFDLLAMLKGTYEADRASSLHEFDYSHVKKE